jgi:hypothetical protein
MFKEYKITKFREVLKVLCSPFIFIRGIVLAISKKQNVFTSIANCNYFFSCDILKMWENKCLICGKTTDIMHSFGYIKFPVGEGEHKKIGECKLGDSSFDVVKWTGKFEKIRYLECEDCVNEKTD